MEVMLLLFHRQQATQSARTWHDYRLEIMQCGHIWHDYLWPWVSLTWLLYNLHLDDIKGADFENSLYAFSQSEEREWVQCIWKLKVVLSVYFSCLCHFPDWVSQLLCVILVETEHSAVAMWFLSSSTLSPLLHSLPALQDFSFWLITFTSFQGLGYCCCAHSPPFLYRSCFLHSSPPLQAIQFLCPTPPVEGLTTGSQNWVARDFTNNLA